MKPCPWCPARLESWHALHTHFAAAHVGNPESAHRKTLGRNGIGGCRSGVLDAVDETMSVDDKRPGICVNRPGPGPTAAAKPHGRTCIT